MKLGMFSIEPGAIEAFYLKELMNLICFMLPIPGLLKELAEKLNQLS